MKKNNGKNIQTSKSKSLLKDLEPLVNRLNELSIQAYQAYKPLVEDLIIIQTKDDNKIQLTLDYILDFCYDEQMLILYKKLCRYYWEINPQVTANYINYYREMWDGDKKEKIG